jgi:hypothetical protein
MKKNREKESREKVGKKNEEKGPKNTRFNNLFCNFLFFNIISLKFLEKIITCFEKSQNTLCRFWNKLEA